MPHDSNPFATRFTQPGALEFLLPPGESLDDLVARLKEHRWWGQIVGPHGSGKSTLLAALRPKLESAGREVAVVVVRPDAREAGGWGPGTRAREAIQAARESTAATLLVIDGYERLSWWSRWRVKSWCRRRGAGLLVTAHADVGLWTVFRTQPSLDLARQIVRRLLPPEETRITEADLTAAYQRHPDNLREVLFALYDVWRSRST